MHKFKVGDWAKVIDSTKKSFGKFFKIKSIDVYSGKYEVFSDVLEFWSERCIQLAETHEVWDKLTPSEKYEYNTVALKALADDKPIQEFFAGSWVDIHYITIEHPYRPKPKETMPDTVIKWRYFKDEKPPHNKRCYILLEDIVHPAFYNGYGAFKLNCGSIVTSKWWSLY